jgi:phosphoribosylamine---glycine ligase
MRLNSDLAEMIDAAIDGRLDQIDVEWDTRVALGVVLAAGGYPSDYRKGDLITGLDAANSTSSRVFHAGTRRLEDGGVVTDGGRVLCVVGLGEDFRRAQENAYRASQNIHFNGIYFRSDIGHRALERRG